MHVKTCLLSAIFIFSVTTIDGYALIDRIVGESGRAVVGILSMEMDSDNDCVPEMNYTSYIAASYVKYMESAAFRVVPILIGRERPYYENLAKSVNGIVFTGGNVEPLSKQLSPFIKAATILLDVAKTNQIPLLAICMGFESLVYIESPGEDSPLSLCLAQNIPMPLTFKEDFRTSKLFRHAPESIVNILEKEKVTANFHSNCVSEETFNAIGMNESYRVLSTNRDALNFEFISSFESRTHDIFAFIFHPEKNIYEWGVDSRINHSAHGVKVSRYFLDVYASAVRRNNNTFESRDEEYGALIYNYHATFTRNMATCNSNFDQIYYFN